MKIILGKKMHMTQVFDDLGAVQSATVVSAGPITVTQIKNKERDGYNTRSAGRDSLYSAGFQEVVQDIIALGYGPCGDSCSTARRHNTARCFCRLGAFLRR